VVDRVRGSDDSGTSAVRAVNTARLQDLGLTMQRFDTAIRTEATGTPRVATPCANGGTIDITGTTTVFTNCRTLIDTNGDGQTDAAQVLNGSLDVSVTSSTLSIVTNTLTTSITSLANNRVLERTTLNITVTGTTHSSSACRGVTVPTALTLVLNGTFSLQLDIDGNGTLEVDTSSQAQGFTIMSRINTFDPNLCIPRDLSASVSGQLSVTDNLNSNASFTLISSPSNPLTISVSTITGGVNITLRGSFSTSAPCFTGSLTVDTPTPLFFPTTTFNISGECPTAGVLTVTGSQIGTIRYTPTGGVTIDNGSDGSIDQTFNTCDDAKACL